jgi:hypothetical protein
MFWRILLGDEAAGGGGSAVAASSDAGDAGGSDSSDTSTESTDSPSDGDGSGTTDAATTGTDADYSYAPPPEEDDTDNGEEDTGSAGGLDTAPSPALTGDAAVAALLAQGQAPVVNATTVPATPATAAPAVAPIASPAVVASTDISAVVKGFADAVGLEATDPALKSFTDILTTAQTEAIAAKQALQQQSQLASVERLFSVMESAPGYSADIFGEADTLSGDPKFGLTAEQLQRRTAVDLQAANIFKAAKDSGKPISAKAAIRQAVEKVASFYPTSTPKPAAPKPQASPTAMAPGRTQAKKPKDPFAAALDAYEKSKARN